MSFYRLEELLPDEIEARLKACPLLVLPFGTLEWHSRHLPVGLDSLVAQGLCERIAGLLDAVLVPVSYWAVGGVPYPFTLNLPLEMIGPVMVALFEQFGGMGFQVIVGFTGHFGLEQTLALKRAALTVMRGSPVAILPVTEYDMTTDAGYTGDHAAEGETSLLWSLRPDLVRLDAVAPGEPLEGILGVDPRRAANPERGRQASEAIVTRTAEVARRLWLDTSPDQRGAYIQALELGVAVLEKIRRQRQVLPKSQVPPVLTPAYMQYCQAIYRGDYAVASTAIQRKLEDLAE